MNNIRLLRKEKKVSMKELGAQIGVSESTISLYENEKRQPDLQTLSRIADYFDVSVDYLLGRDLPAESETSSPVIKLPEKYKDIALAFNSGADNLTSEDIQDVVKYIEFVKAKKNK